MTRIEQQGLPQLTTTTKERQKLLATLMKLTLFVIIASSIPDFYYVIPESIAVILVTALLIGVFLYINKRGHVEFAGNGLVFLLSSILFVQCSQLSFDSLVFLFYIPLIIGTPFVVDYKKKYLFYFHLFHPLFFIALLFATDFSLWKINTYNDQQISMIAAFNVIAILILIHYMLFLIIQSSKRSEKKLEQAVDDLNIQNIELQKINNELDRFVYSVSHDLRAPLASTLGLIELSKDEPSMEKILYYNALKEKSLHRLDDYVNSLLDFSRNYRIELLKEEIELKALVEQCIELNRPYSDDASKVHISVDVQQQLPFYGDSLRVRIILNNLISNGLKYYDDYKEWQVLSIKVNADAEMLVIKVEDNGIGIDASLVDHVFDMFYRASERPKGSGLGLYITKEVVGKLQGEISIQSRLGEGTTFTVKLPNNNP